MAVAVHRYWKAHGILLPELHKSKEWDMKKHLRILSTLAILLIGGLLCFGCSNTAKPGFRVKA